MIEESGAKRHAYFLGPKSENEAGVRADLHAILGDWFEWRKSLFGEDEPAIGAAEQAAPDFLRERALVTVRLAELIGRLRAESPTYSPRYVGHMVSELALPALLGHFAALLHNPNNTSKEVSKAGTIIEAEAIAMLASMIGFDAGAARGHFTSGGTVANLEAVWRARFRMDHWLALALTLAEEHGRPLDAFRDAHMGWEEFRTLVRVCGADEGAMRARSAVLGNPIEIAARIAAQTGKPYRGPVILAPGHKHYSWPKAANVFGLGEEAFWTIPVDREGRLSVERLSARIDEARRAGRPVLMVVCVAGTTELGELDPIDAVMNHLDALLRGDGVDIWRHVDAAYGGYFCALDPQEPLLAPARRRALKAIRRAHTVTIDPHKLGYAPYACGALLARDAACDAVSAFGAPYVERADLDAAPWMATLEGSRPATGAAATWLTGKTLGFGPEGIGALLRDTIEAGRAMRAALCEAIPQIRPLEPMDTNIFCFSLAEDGDALSLANARTAGLHARLVRSPNFSMSKTTLDEGACADLIDAHVASYRGRRDTGSLVLMRCVVMNPFWGDPGVRARLIPALIAELRGFVAEITQQRLTPGQPQRARQASRVISQ